MTNNGQEKDNSFIFEKIKERPINKKKLVKKTITTISMAVLFGLVACVTFLVLQPVIDNLLYPKETPNVIIFPEDQQEMLPADMMSENLEDEKEEQSEQGEESDSFWEDKLREKEYLEAAIEATGDYRKTFLALKEYVNELQKCMVEITGTTSDTNWLVDEYENTSITTGVVIDNNGKEVTILTDAATIKNAENLQVEFYDGKSVPIQTIQRNEAADIALLRINLNLVEGVLTEEEVYVAQIGSSNAWKLVGTPVVAIGSPMGTNYSVGYGMVTSQNRQVNDAELNYRLLTTDIYGSSAAKGFLFDMQGQMIGIINQSSNPVDMKNQICAYGITEMKQIMSRLSKGTGFAYLGLTTIDVSEEANAMMQIPYGAYIKDIDMNSPAMQAGLHRGDIIIKVNDREITNATEYIDAMMWLEAGRAISLEVKRLSQTEYKPMKFEITLGELK